MRAIVIVRFQVLSLTTCKFFIFARLSTFVTCLDLVVWPHLRGPILNSFAEASHIGAALSASFSLLN